jgi:serine/threonine protein kinase
MSTNRFLPLPPDDRLLTALSHVLALEAARTEEKIHPKVQAIQFSKAYFQRLLKDWSDVLREKYQIDVATLPRIPGGITLKKKPDGSFQFVAVPRTKSTTALSKSPFYYLEIREKDASIPEEELLARAAALPHHAPIIMYFNNSYKTVIFGWLDNAWKQQTLSRELCSDDRIIIQDVDRAIKYDGKTNSHIDGYYQSRVSYLYKYHDFYKGETLGRGGFGKVKKVQSLPSSTAEAKEAPDSENALVSKTFSNSLDEDFRVKYVLERKAYANYGAVHDARMQKELEIECYFNSLLERDVTLVYKMKADGTLEEHPWRYLGKFFPGVTLSSITSLPLAEFYDISFKLLCAVQSLHQHPTGCILHRDIHSANFLYDRTGMDRSIFLIDLGQAMNAFTENFLLPYVNTIAPDNPADTIYLLNKHRRVGVPEYAAPETRLNPPVYSPASDIYAIAVTLQELLKKTLEVSAAKKSDLSDLLASMKQKDPAKRPSIQDVIANLKKIQNDPYTIVESGSFLEAKTPIDDTHPHKENLQTLAAYLQRVPHTFLDLPVSVIKTLPTLQFDLNSTLGSRLLLGLVTSLIFNIHYNKLSADHEGEKLLDLFGKWVSTQKNVSLAWQGTLEFLQTYFFNPYIMKNSDEMMLACKMQRKHPALLLLSELLPTLMNIVKSKTSLDDGLSPDEQLFLWHFAYSFAQHARVLSQPDSRYSADLERIFTALDTQTTVGKSIITIFRSHQERFYPNSRERQLLERLLKVAEQSPHAVMETILKAPTAGTPIKITLGKAGITFFKKQLLMPAESLPAHLLPPAREYETVKQSGP